MQEDAKDLTREQVLEMITRAYESAVVMEARKSGGNPTTFLEAAGMLSHEVMAQLRASFEQQLEQLR